MVKSDTGIDKVFTKIIDIVEEQVLWYLLNHQES
jgi:hypothetical protein